jgi:hypothetical protein
MEPTTTPENLFDLQIDHQSSAYLSQAAKWAKFLAIVGFVFCGFFLLWGIFAGTIINIFTSKLGSESAFPMGSAAAAGLSNAILFIFALIFAAVYFFPCFFLYRFATKMQVALRNNDQGFLNNSFGNLKSFYKYIGILMIIALSFFLLEILFVMIFAASTFK